jgi:hypothetical protein
VAIEGPGDSHYPHGTKINLEHDEVKKLGMHKAKVGDQFMVHGHAHVTSVNEGQDEGGEPRHSIGLHIRKMAVKKHRPETGRVKDEASDGAKAAMDEALTEEANTANSD